eukprot:TRINITY_DN8078_c0_g1_i1.p1 TRINITY_DN8078_c0_g1~~TRINITY_DN8078_c0_g1_i1.p1  ORF type:complete len:340 (-),score=78.77 TRINITY_DN8078_c0_g1_i1:576-1595(-)
MAEGAPVRSWAQAAQTVEAEVPLKVVKIDGLVALKIIKHCREYAPSMVTGSLLGLDIGSTLEVTNCFPVPGRGGDEDEEQEADGANYQLEMMRCLREVNVDNNTIGWYQSTYMGSYHTTELIDTFMNYQENIKRCVCLIYDPLRSGQGVLALKALKLTEPFMKLYRAGEFIGEKLREVNLSWQGIFEEIPVKIANSTLVSALMNGLEKDDPVTQCDFDRFGLSTHPFMEKNLEFLIECMDDLSMEQQKVQFYNRNVARQEAQRMAWLQKRRSENQARRAAGEELLPEDEVNKVFKPLPEPSRLDSYLIINQVSNYCTQINGFASQSVSKMYLMDAVHEE